MGWGKLAYSDCGLSLQISAPRELVCVRVDEFFAVFMMKLKQKRKRKLKTNSSVDKYRRL